MKISILPHGHRNDAWREIYDNVSGQVPTKIESYDSLEHRPKMKWIVNHLQNDVDFVSGRVAIYPHSNVYHLLNSNPENEYYLVSGYETVCQYGKRKSMRIVDTGAANLTDKRLCKRCLKRKQSLVAAGIDLGERL